MDCRDVWVCTSEGDKQQTTVSSAQKQDLTDIT